MFHYGLTRCSFGELGEYTFSLVADFHVVVDCLKRRA